MRENWVDHGQVAVPHERGGVHGLQPLQVAVLVHECTRRSGFSFSVSRRCARTSSDRVVRCFARDPRPGRPLELRQAGLLERCGRRSEAVPADGSGEGEFGGGPAMGCPRLRRQRAAGSATGAASEVGEGVLRDEVLREQRDWGRLGR